MFDFLKKRGGQSITVYLLFGAIIIVFVFWGVGQEKGSGIEGYAATVNNHVISLGEYSRLYEQQSRYLSSMGGEDLDAERRIRFRAAILDRLIGGEMVAQGADSEGVKISDDEVRDQILNIEAFQENGRFRRDLYQGFLTQRQISAGQFESELRRELKLNQIQSLFFSALGPSKEEVEMEKAARSTKVKVDYATFDTENAAKDLKVSEKEVTDFIAKAVNQKALQDYYEANKSKYTKPARVHARHILAKFKAGDSQSESDALKKIEGAFARVNKNENFEKVAKDVSEDEGSKSKGGDLGFFEKGRMVPEFEQAAFATDPGKVVGPVKSSFGFHIIQVVAKENEKVDGLDAVKASIAKEVIALNRAKNLVQELDKLLSSGKTKDAEVLLSQQGMKWNSTEGFDAAATMIARIGPAEDFMSVAFSLTKGKPWAKRLAREGSKVYVLKFKGQETQKPEGEKDIQKELAQARTGDALNTWQKELSKSAKIQRNERLLRL